ncbi:yme2 [Symbiodinium sp. CCMP2592]|nr:yme2 [Symbiodinium sp. CCMP2592]
MQPLFGACRCTASLAAEQAAEASYHGILWVANVYPRRVHCFDFRQIRARYNHETLIPRLLPEGLQFKIHPRRQEGGAFVHFRMPPTFILQVMLAARAGSGMPKTIDDILFKVSQDMCGNFVKTHNVWSFLCPYPVRIHRVLGTPPTEDVTGQYPSSQIHVKFNALATIRPTERQVYEVLRTYGQLESVVASPSGFIANFRYIPAAIAVRNCLHGAPLQLKGQKESASWAFEYKQISRWDRASANLLFWFPLYASLILSVLFFWDRLRAASSCNYSLTDPNAFVRFLVEGDVRLVRLAYLLELQRAQLSWPRRQEAESAILDTGEPALVTLQELREIQSQDPLSQRGFFSRSGKLIRFGSVSHCWESREHPDPWGFQLNEAIRRFQQMEGERSEVWLFVDFLCLHQYPRNKEQTYSFQRALQAMHVLYAHELVNVETLRDLTPEFVRSKLQGGRKIAVYSTAHARVEQVPVESLMINSVPYDQRGWCQAEEEWASLRETFERVPTPPMLFSRRMDTCRFTHRDDSALVKELQEKIFKQKAKETTKLNLQLLDDQVPVLCAALPYYTNLEIVLVRDTKLGCEGARVVVESGASHIHLDNCELGDAEANAIAKALEKTAGVHQLSLRHTRITPVGADALRRAGRIFGAVCINLDGQKI